MTKVWGILTGVAGLIIAFVVAGIVLTRIVSNHDKAIIEAAVAKQKVHENDSTESVLAPRSDSIRTVYVDRWHTYTQVRDSIIRLRPNDSAVKVLAGRCDQLIVTCEERHAVDSTRIANLQGEVKTLKGMKAAKPSRASAFIIGGYDWYNKQPLAQVGGDYRLIGNFSATAFLETARGDAPDRLKTRGVLAAKFTFR